MISGFFLRKFLKSGRMDHLLRKLQNEAWLVIWMSSRNDFGSQDAA